MPESSLPPQPSCEHGEQASPTRAPESTTRREFIKATGTLTGAAVLGGCFGGGDIDGGQAPAAGAPGAAAALAQFDHVVVVMFENRSFDNLLGYLYPASGAPRNQTYDGLAGKSYSNPVPAYIHDGHAEVSTRVSPGTDADMSNPNPDPGEAYPHVNTQLYGVVDPPDNRFRSTKNMSAPFNAPAPGQQPTMTGFVQDYCNNWIAQTNPDPKQTVPTGLLPLYEQYRVIMDGFSPEQLPVISTLAREFAVYDHWFCAAPTQTFPNRSFFHASSSSGHMFNEPYTKWITNTAPTIFNRLHEAGLSWKIYYDATQVISLTGLIHTPELALYWKSHFATMDTFYQDVANGTLPAYAFVEPRMLFNHNDFHPPTATFVIDDKLPIGATSDVRAGDLLLHQIYSAVRTSASSSGSNAQNTLLLVTFDEHGGNFDHVPPPAAVQPYRPQPEGEFGFMFDRLGVRVPAIAISAYTEANTVIHREMHHGALIRTLCEKYGLAHLTERDRTAPDLSDAINRTTPRAAATWPVTVPRPVPPGALVTDPASPQLASRPLNDLERGMMGLAMAYFQGAEPAPDAIPTTVGAAHALLTRIANGSFGR